MPTQSVSAETMEIGKKGRGKHWTAEEKAARVAAANALKRKKTNIIAPDGMNSGALYIWKRVVDDAAELGDGSLLDNLDTDVLKDYCNAVDIAQTLYKTISDGTSTDPRDDMKMLQGWYRIIAGHADKLGFTPQARARLVKKRAEDPKKDGFGNEFD